MLVENHDYVKCCICGFEGAMLNRHLSKHNITAEEYRMRYPEALVSCRAVMDRQSNSVSKTWYAKPKIEKQVLEHVCHHCGGRFNHLCNLQLHLKKEDSLFINGKEGEDFVVCGICGMRSENLEPHIRISHKMSVEKYRTSYAGKTISDRWKKQMMKSQTGKHTVLVEKRSGAILCCKCREWYLTRFSAKHLSSCVHAHPDKYIAGKDYVKCPECGEALTRLGEHLQKLHGWNKDRIALEVGRGLKLSADSVVDKWRTGQDFKESQKKREKTHFERHGFTNPFSNPVVQEKITETSQRRYGVNHPMKDEEILIRQRESAQMGPSSLEVFFMDKITVPNVIYSGYGGRFIRTKIGVRKYGRVIKDLNPDFMVLPDNVLVSAKSAVVEGRPLDRQKHRTRWVIELLGDWFHSERMIGVKPEEHEREVVASYKSAGIECLTLWEKDVMDRWDIIGPMVEAWIEKAVRDMNENPIYSKSIKRKESLTNC